MAEAATAAFEDGLAEAISSETGDYTTDNSTVLVRIISFARRRLPRHRCTYSSEAHFSLEGLCTITNISTISTIGTITVVYTSPKKLNSEKNCKQSHARRFLKNEQY